MLIHIKTNKEIIMLDYEDKLNEAMRCWRSLAKHPIAIRTNAVKGYAMET